MISKEDRQRLRELAAKATPDWEYVRSQIENDNGERGYASIHLGFKEPRLVLRYASFLLDEDAELGARARNAIIPLLDSLEAAEARAEKAEDLLAALTSHNPWHFSDCDPSYCIFCDCAEAEEATASEHTPNCDFRLATEYVIQRRRAK